MLKLKSWDGVTAVVSWLPPDAENVHGQIIGYHALVINTETGTFFNQTVNSSVSSLHVSELDPEVTYVFRVAVANRVGVGPYSSPLPLHMDPSRDTQLVPSVNLSYQVVQQTWFIGLIGALVFISLAVFLVLLYIRRLQAQKPTVFTSADEALLKICALKPTSTGPRELWISDNGKSGSIDSRNHKLMSIVNPDELVPMNIARDECNNNSDYENVEPEEYAEYNNSAEQGPYASTLVSFQAANQVSQTH